MTGVNVGSVAGIVPRTSVARYGLPTIRQVIIRGGAKACHEASGVSVTAPPSLRYCLNSATTL
jgi:hypothetical protein